jgi:hypothetical protein
MAKPIKQAIDSLTKLLSDINQSKLSARRSPKRDINKLIKALREFEKDLDNQLYHRSYNGNIKNREKHLATLKKQLNRCKERHGKSNNFEDIEKIITENIAYYQESKAVLIYWNGPGELCEKPPGIAILTNDFRGNHDPIWPRDFKEQAIKNLEYLYKTKTGKEVLDTLCKFSSIDEENKLFIFPPLRPFDGNSAQQTSDTYLHDIAIEIIEPKIPLKKQTLDALNNIAFKHIESEEERYQWLADKINEMPELTLDGELTATPYFNTLNKKISINAKEIESWLHGDNPFTDYDDEIQSHIKNATIAILHDYAKKSLGCGTVVRWNIDPLHPKNQKRPPAIGLGHELIHAYYNAKGMQPGHPPHDESTVLFEYITVGLGPWADSKISENALRKQWNDVVNQVDENDVLNLKKVGPREFYSPKETTDDLNVNLDSKRSNIL